MNVVTSVFREAKASKNGQTWHSYSVSQQRRYNDEKAGKTAYSEFLYEQDLLDANQGLLAAYDWIRDDKHALREASQAEDAANGES